MCIYVYIYAHTHICVYVICVYIYTYKSSACCDITDSCRATHLWHAEQCIVGLLAETNVHTQIKWRTVNRKWCQSQQPCLWWPHLWHLFVSDDIISDTCLSDDIISDACLSLSAARLWRAADAENPVLWLAEMVWAESERLMINHMGINNE